VTTQYILLLNGMLWTVLLWDYALPPESIKNLANAAELEISIFPKFRGRQMLSTAEYHHSNFPFEEKRKEVEDCVQSFQGAAERSFTDAGDLMQMRLSYLKKDVYIFMYGIGDAPLAFHRAAHKMLCLVDGLQKNSIRLFFEKERGIWIFHAKRT